jgi:uncharacterized membrane protein SirB2
MNNADWLIAGMFALWALILVGIIALGWASGRRRSRIRRRTRWQ